MSIFLEQHHDTLLLEYLTIDELARLSQISKYYYNITKDKLQPFRTFFQTRNTIPLEIIFGANVYWSTYRDNGSHHVFHIIINMKDKCNVLKLMIQAYFYGDLKIINYIKHKTKALAPNTKINLKLYKYSSTYSDIRYDLQTILVLIAIYTKRLDILYHLKDFYGDFLTLDFMDIESYIMHDLDKNYKDVLYQGKYSSRKVHYYY